MDTVWAIIGTIVGSAGLFSLLQFLITRHDKKNDRLGEIGDKIDSVSKRLDEQGARIARANILRFDDELINGEHHSREYFRSVLEDVDNYEAYCREHTGFKNSFTAEAAEHIRKVYNRLIDEGAFRLKQEESA